MCLAGCEKGAATALFTRQSRLLYPPLLLGRGQTVSAGSGDREGAARVSSYCFWVTIAVGALTGVLMLARRTPMVYLIGASEGTFSHAAGYYTRLALGRPALMLSFIHSNLLRAEDKSRRSMVGTILGAVVNIILDPIFISVLGLGAAGAAIATIIGYLVSDIFFAVIVEKQSRLLSVSVKKIRLAPGQAGRIFAIGIPAAVANLMQSVSVVFLNQFLLPYGNDKIAAMGIAMKVSMIALLLLTGFAFGGRPLFGYYYGAGDKDRLDSLLKFCVKFISCVAAALSVGIFAGAPLLMRMFMEDRAIVNDGALMLRRQVVTMVCVGLILLMTIICQSMGKAAASFRLSVSRQGVVFLAVLLAARRTVGYRGIVWAQAVADIITLAVARAVYFKVLCREFKK